MVGQLTNEPVAYNPLCSPSVWAAFRAQRAVARALANDEDAPCLSLVQVEAMASMIGRDGGMGIAAVVMQLRMSGLPLEGTSRNVALAGIAWAVLTAVSALEVDQAIADVTPERLRWQGEPSDMLLPADAPGDKVSWA